MGLQRQGQGNGLVELTWCLTSGPCDDQPQDAVNGEALRGPWLLGQPALGSQ